MTDIGIPHQAASGPRPHTVLPARSLILLGLGLIIFMDAADAYTIASVPMPWLGMVAAVPMIVIYAIFARVRLPPASGVYLVLLVWLFGDTVVHSLLGDYGSMMPIYATTPYPMFVVLRGYNFLGFLLLMTVIYNYAKHGSDEELINILVWMGVFVTLFAFYVLVAQRLQLPMPTKTRFGTGVAGAIAGGDTGAFGDGNERYLFRTIGSFREPSFLGIWLIVPFFYSFSAKARRAYHWRSILIGLGILSTGSLTAAAAVAAAFLLTLQIIHPLSRRSLGAIGGIIVMAVVAGLILNWIGTTYFQIDDGFSFIDQYWPRIERILTGGIGASNRGYAFEEFLNSEFSLVGDGLGNAHLANNRSPRAPISFLSLYFHAWFAGGAIGLFLLVLYLAMPILLFAMRYRWRTPEGLWYLAPYIASLVVFTVNDENFNVMSALTIGLLLAHLMRLQPPNPAAARP